eukprot:12882083-Prorocentrum_lima.AAC.1
MFTAGTRRTVSRTCSPRYAVSAGFARGSPWQTARWDIAGRQGLRGEGQVDQHTTKGGRRQDGKCR